MSRLDIETQERLEPIRIRTCKEKLESIGFKILSEDNTKLTFMFRDSLIQFWPYSGWHTGKTIKDGRGFGKLLKQLDKSNENV